MSAAKKILAALLVIGLAPLAGMSEPLKFKFDRGRPWGGEGGATGVWQGVVVEVDGNTVTPKFAIQRRIFISWWLDLPAQKIQACPLAKDGFSTSENCVTVDKEKITVPESKSPYDFSYKFLYVSEKGGTSEDSFRLTKP